MWNHCEVKASWFAKSVPVLPSCLGPESRPGDKDTDTAYANCDQGVCPMLWLQRMAAYWHQREAGPKVSMSQLLLSAQHLCAPFVTPNADTRVLLPVPMERTICNQRLLTYVSTLQMQASLTDAFVSYTRTLYGMHMRWRRWSSPAASPACVMCAHFVFPARAGAGGPWQAWPGGLPRRAGPPAAAGVRADGDPGGHDPDRGLGTLQAQGGIFASTRWYPCQHEVGCLPAQGGIRPAAVFGTRVYVHGQQMGALQAPLLGSASTRFARAHVDRRWSGAAQGLL